MAEETSFEITRKRGKKMPEGDLLALIRAHELAALGSSVAAGATISTTVFPSQQTMTTLEITRYNALNAFWARPLGNEVENRSQIVIPELRDTIQWIMPQLMRIFASNPEIFRFDAEGPQDTGQAALETATVNHIFMKLNPGFMILHDFFWDAMLMSNGYVEVYFKKDKETSVESYTQLMQMELTSLLSDKGDEEETEVLEQREYSVPIPMPDGSVQQLPVFDLKIRRTKEVGKVCVEALPPEEMRVSPRVRGTLDDSPFTSHVTEITRSELIAEGFDADTVDSLPQGRPNWWEIDALARNTNVDQLSAESPTDHAMQEIEFHNVVLRVDYDGDGIAELRQVMVGGDTILSNEEIEENPFASGHAIRMPHRHTGISLYDLLMDLQILKSTLFRQGIDNLAISNQTRIGADWKNVNIDDLMTVRPGGVVRTQGPPANSLMPIVQPSNLVQQVIPALEYCDTMREMRTGVGNRSMGLDADELQDVTKGGQLAAMSAASLKIELIARLLAEGVIEIAKKIHSTAQRHQDQPLNFEMAGKWVKVDPTSWRRRTRVTARVGLGSGNREEARANIQMLGQAQGQITQFGLVGPKQAYQTFKDAVSVLGFENPEKYAMDPDSPEYQQYKQSQPPPQPAPQVQAAQIRAQTDLQKAQGAQQTQIMALKGKLIEAQSKIMAEREKSQAEILHAQIQAQHDREHDHTQGAHTRMVTAAANADNAKELPSDPPQMDVNLIGLTGPVGVLPQHYSVVLINELRHRNLALRDFFDLFNHRLIAFFYRAWVKYRIPISVERDGTHGGDGATQMLRALVGFATDRLAQRSRIGQHSLLHYAGLLGHLPRNAASLQQLLLDYFGLPIRIEQFRARWLLLPPEQRSRVGRRGRFVGLGVDAALGESFCDMQGNFAILIGPIGYGEFLQFMPEGAKLDELAALTRLYVDPQLGFRVELVLARREIPRLQLAAGASPRLGWNTWLRHYPAAEDARDAGWYL